MGGLQSNPSGVSGGWVGYYEFNTLDQNGLIGRHPLADDHYNINGFSGHGKRSLLVPNSVWLELCPSSFRELDSSGLV